MSQERWTEVDRYITEKLLRPDTALDAALRSSAEAGLPPINVSPPQGMLLMLLARATGARRILEIGALGGYSTIWLARALPAGGLLTTLELDPKHARVASANIRRAGLSRVVEVRQGPALETLPRLEAERKGPFDLSFIDADKQSNPDYFAWALKLSRPGSLIIVDNVIRDGAVVDRRSRDPDVRGVRRLNDVIAAEPRVIATEIQTVGSKGYDGFAIALVVVPLARGKK
ncbi:MAG TPA: O-methyltransferase [Nitrososphaerales archaeon]|nr:O-methyltransferase [Nitrososphaerales archaeon]